MTPGTRGAAAGAVVWFTGLPSSGKSTLARAVASALAARAVPACVLDGDEVRAALVPPPSYDDAGRAAFYTTLANLGALLAGQGLVVLVPATANRRAFRAHARDVAPRFVEVYVSTDASACEARDAKGLYARFRAGGATGLPGPGAGYEVPLAPDVVAEDGLDARAVEAVLARLGA